MRCLILRSMAALICAAATLCLSETTSAQVTKTVGETGADYATLKAAFADINAGTLTGDVTLQIIANTTEATTAVLNGSGTGAANYTSVLIYPVVSNLYIAGNPAAPLIDLNGADHVTIDGRVNATGSVKSLVIVNYMSSATAGTSTIRFVNDATFNTVKYCILRGSEAASGVLFFSMTTGALGNDDNLIDHNDITCGDAMRRPIYAIYSSGNNSGITNDRNTISNNNVFDFLSTRLAAYGIYIDYANNNWTIIGNSFYETTPVIPEESVPYTIIYCVSSPADRFFTINDNYIGGRSPGCGTLGGSTAPWTKPGTRDNKFTAIFIGGGTDFPTNIQGNIIQNINWANSAGASWTGIETVNGGYILLGTETGNIIGAASGNGSVVFTAGSAGLFKGIVLNSQATLQCKNNRIGAITLYNSAGSFTNFYGIFSTGSYQYNYSYIENNIIGSTDPATINSINYVSGNLGSEQMYGIYHQDNAYWSIYNGNITIARNIISGFRNGCTDTTLHSAGCVQGIYVSGGLAVIVGNTIRSLTIANGNNWLTNDIAAAGIVFNSSINLPQTISGNVIYGISNTFPSFTGAVAGIYYAGSTSSGNVVSKNFIHDLSVSFLSTAATIYGIKVTRGKTDIINNIISVGTSDGISTDGIIYGIYESGAAGNNNNFYFNTVHISGEPQNNAAFSYAFYSAANTNTRDIRDNIFGNFRSNQGANGNHYAAFFNYSTPGALTLNYNDYYAPGNGGFLGYFNATDFSDLPIITGYDASSFAVDPLFSNAGGNTGQDYFPGVAIPGISIPVVTTDFYGNPRSGTPLLGALEATISLPLTWLDIKATQQSRQGLITWNTANEVDVKDYTVQHSVNGQNWNTIGYVTAMNKPSGAAYHFIHSSPIAGHNYYRVQQRSENGTSSYSRVVDLDFKGTAGIQVFGNPVQHGQLMVKMPAAGTLFIYSRNGQLIQTTWLDSGMQSLNVGLYPKGLYLLRSGTEVVKFIID